MNLTLNDIAKILNAKTLTSNLKITGFSTDSRTLQPGDCFVALQGPNYDGNDYIADAKAKGAVAAISSKEGTEGLPTVCVNDTLQALATLASWVRQQAKAKVVALTGSNGKTTTKELIASILRQQGNTLSTQGNFNNNIGLPLTLLKLQPEHQYLVLEMGANHPGEISTLTKIARPDVALITNIAPAHLAGFGTVDDVAKAKSEIFQGLTINSVAIINLDDPRAAMIRNAASGHRQIAFSKEHAADVYATNIQFKSDARPSFVLYTPDSSVDIQLPLLGEHQIQNALAAASVAYALGISIQKMKIGLETVTPVSGRLVTKYNKHGLRVLDDTYNANPYSVKAGINVLAKFTGEKILILGDMGELGENAVTYHEYIGQVAKESDIDRLYCFGQLTQNTAKSFGAKAHYYADIDDICQHLNDEKQKQATILVKGSRSMRMERVVNFLLETGEE